MHCCCLLFHAFFLSMPFVVFPITVHLRYGCMQEAECKVLHIPIVLMDPNHTMKTNEEPLGSQKQIYMLKCWNNYEIETHSIMLAWCEVAPRLHKAEGMVDRKPLICSHSGSPLSAAPFHLCFIFRLGIQLVWWQQCSTSGAGSSCTYHPAGSICHVLTQPLPPNSKEDSLSNQHFFLWGRRCFIILSGKGQHRAACIAITLLMWTGKVTLQQAAAWLTWCWWWRCFFWHVFLCSLQLSYPCFSPSVPGLSQCNMKSPCLNVWVLQLHFTSFCFVFDLCIVYLRWLKWADKPEIRLYYWDVQWNEKKDLPAMFKVPGAKKVPDVPLLWLTLVQHALCSLCMTMRFLHFLWTFEAQRSACVFTCCQAVQLHCIFLSLSSFGSNWTSSGPALWTSPWKGGSGARTLGLLWCHSYIHTYIHAYIHITIHTTIHYLLYF